MTHEIIFTSQNLDIVGGQAWMIEEMADREKFFFGFFLGGGRGGPIIPVDQAIVIFI